MKFLNRNPWLLCLIIVAIVAIPAYWRMESITDENTHLLACIKDWSDAQSARTTALSGASQDRFTALSQIIDGVTKGDDAATLKAAKAYEAGDAAYKAIGKAHPAPEMKC